MRLQWLLAAGLALTVSACSAAGTNQNVPPTYSGNAAGTIMNGQMQPAAVDTTSVLKQLTKQVSIGSTVDPSNGDQDPYGLVYVKQAPYGKAKIQKGDLVACNYSNKSGTEGAGTTLEVLSTKPGSNPSTLIENAKLKGCSSLAIGNYDPVYSTDSSAKNVATTQPNGKLGQVLTNKNIVKPWSVAYNAGFGYPPGDALYASDASSGKIVRINLGAGSAPTYSPVISGLAVNKGAPGSILGPTGLQFDSSGRGTLYIFDGVTNTLIAITDPYDNLVAANSIVVGSDGKTFSGPKAKDAHVVYAGSSLKKPVASALLPNGNLVVANSGSTKGNYLVEIATNGKVLANKNVDTGKPGAIHGLVAVGSKDSNTVIYFNDSNTNEVRELTR
jgi:hypothetical protein